MTQTDELDPGIDMDLMAYADGVLPPERLADVEARLARDPDARAAVAQWRHFDNLIRQQAAEADTLPANLRIAALERDLAAKLQRRQWRARLLGPALQRIAAGVVFFAAGWLAHSVYTTGQSRIILASQPYFIGPTLAGHSSYSFASYQQTEFGSEQMAEALDWMSEQMQQKINSPKLERLGYEVESARLMFVDDQPVAVFYYRNDDDERVTVSISPRPTSQAPYKLRVANQSGYNMAYWSSANLNYTVVSDRSSAAITTFAAAVQD